MSLPTISSAEARQLLHQGAILVDIRESDEHVREKIAGAHRLPLSKLDESDLARHEGNAVIFHCKSGARTVSNASLLAEKAGGACEAYIIEGGLDAWKKAGLPVVADRRHSIELQRQVQIGAGSLAFFGTMLGLLASSWFFAVPAFVGAGLMVAGAAGRLRTMSAGGLEQSRWY